MMNKANTDKTKITRRQSSESGVAAVEFAILLIPLLLIVAGIIEFGRALWYYDALVKSTRDGARYLSNSRESLEVPIGSIMEASAIAIVKNAANAANLDVSSLNVDVSCDTSCSINTPNYVTVSVSYPITIGGWIPIIVPTGATSWSSTLSPHTTMRYMR
jgi:Flp pilus assembly protein TadG